MNRNLLIFFYGPPFVGKSTLGSAFAHHLNMPFWDVDEIISSRTGTSIEQIFSDQEEAHFRDWEYRVLKELCEKTHGVVALGGGALTKPQTRKLVEDNGNVLFLEASQKSLLNRIQENEEIRPLLGQSPEKGLKRLLEERTPHYMSFSRRISVDNKSPRELVQEVESLLGMFRVGGMRWDYDIRVRQGCLEEIGEELRARNYAGPIVMVTDDRVEVLYAGRVQRALEEVGYEVSLISFPAGERSKTMNTVQQIWEEFLSTAVERISTVIALGGGVVGDLTGFSAATYYRGVNWVDLPTSLLAMVDASIGGKTGADLPQGKNLVGVFHPPRLVWTDPETLHTLPKEELRNGMAEVIKHGMIADPELFSLAAEGKDGFEEHCDEVICRAVGVKIDIIQKDPYDRHQRQVLNFGHTIGHAVELVSGYRLRHGEAVAIGMTAETYIAEQLGMVAASLTKNLVEVLLTWGLPVEIPPTLPAEDIIEAMKRDKKIAQGRLRFSLPFDVGDVRLGIAVGERDIRDALEFKKEGIDG